MAANGLAQQALTPLDYQLAQPQPCVATASIVLGTLQDRLFLAKDGEQQHVLSDAVAAHMQRFQDAFVAPAAAKLGKCKTAQDKVVAIAKFLRGKLAKAPAHKQPLHTQYLPSALRESGKRQLDCLGIATAVLAMCHQVAAQQPEQHSQLAAAVMVVSDDHCWLALPAPGQAAAGAAGDGGQQQQREMVHIEVTDPCVLTPGQLAGSWLYAGGHGTLCSPAQVVLVLVAGLMPEEVTDEAAAEQLAQVQDTLLRELAAAHPQALFYSNFFRWGMLLEETELQELAAAAEAAAASGHMGDLTALALLPPAQLQSQQHYSTSWQRSSGWQWHPSSCAAFGWLNRMQAALCGETDDLLCLTAQQGTAAAGVQPWMDMAVFLLQQALGAVAGCTAVLRQYSGCAGKPNKQADTQLLEAVRDLWQNLADASKAVAYLQQLSDQLQHTQQAVSPARQPQPQGPVEPAAPESTTAAGEPSNCDQQQQQQQQQQPETAQQSPGGHLGSDVPAAAAVGHSHTVHLAAAVGKAAAGSQPQQGVASITMQDTLSTSSWLQAQLEFLDALLCFFGEDSADVPAGIVADAITVAGTFTSAARQQALGDAVGQGVVLSSRVQGLVGSAVWAELQPGLQQQLQMPGSRSRKRQRKD